MTGKVEISALHVHRYAGGRFEFTAFAAGDECPRDCDAKRGPAGGWLFAARRSDLTEADWKQIEHLIENTPGETPSSIRPQPWERSWTLRKLANDSWIISPFGKQTTT
jgi:hypothetical protein